MSGARFVRFYPSDWRSGCIGLTPEEIGVYISVCAHAWETGARLTTDDAIAASRLMLDVRMWRRIKNNLVAKGKLHVAKDGIYSPRAERELAAAQAGAKQAQAPVAVEAGGDGHDREHQNGRVAVERREPSRETLLGEVPEKSPESLREVSENFAKKDIEINAPLKSLKPIAISKEEENPLPPKGGATPMDVLRAFESYNATALRCGLPQASRLTPDRQRKIIARLKDYGLEGWDQALANIEKSSFLTGQNDRAWRASLEWLLQAASFSKAHDGGYGNGRGADHASSAPKKRSVMDVIRETAEKETVQ